MSEPVAPVLSKVQNHRLWQSGAYGNKLRAWSTLSEWRKSGYRGKVALRCLLPSGGGGPCLYDVETNFVKNAYDRYAIDVAPEHIVICEAAPADVVLLQGEYMNGICNQGDGSFWSGYFYHSRVRKQMREALWRSPEASDGLIADLAIRSVMTPTSYEEWRELLEVYPDHVFEVSIYDRCLGDLPHRNALVWEVRRY